MEEFLDDFPVHGQPLVYASRIWIEFVRIPKAPPCPKLGEVSAEKAPIIQPPDWILPIKIMCNASNHTIGTELDQCKKSSLSKALTRVRQTTEKELSVVVFTHDKFRPYLVDVKVLAHGPCYTKISPDQEGRQATTHPLDSCSFMNSLHESKEEESK